MTNKGQVMTQAHYEKEQRYLKLIQEAFWRGEKSRDEVKKALRSIGFSASMAAIKINEWSSSAPQLDCESKGIMNKRLKEIATLEKYFKKKWEKRKTVKRDIKH